MSLLGCMMLDRECIGLVLQIIRAEETERFYRPDHRLLFETLVSLYDAGKPIDLIVLEEELGRRNLLEEVGGRDYLLELVDSVPSAANVEYYAGIVRDKAMLRDLIRATGEIMQSAYSGGESAQKILDDAERKLFDVTEQRVSNQAVSIKEFLAETFELLKSQHDVINGLPTGFRELDEMTGGFQFGDLVIIAARPSMGKTALGLSMLEHLGVDENGGKGYPAVFFSMEMSRLQIVQRLLCSRARVDLTKLRKRHLSEREKYELTVAAGHMQESPIFLDDTPGMSVMEIRAKARRLKMLHDIQIVFVDYLQLMYDPAGKENRQQEIAAISRGLKALARELEIPVIALAQLNRQVEARGSNRPRMSDLRESGAIEQDADVVMLLHREEYYLDKSNKDADRLEDVRGKAELIIDKQRNGPTGVVELHFTPEFTRFDNAAQRYLRDDPGTAHEDYDPRESINPDARPVDEAEQIPF